MDTNWNKRTKRIMREKKITQAEIAPVMGKTTRGAVGHYLTGRSQPTLDQLKALAKHLGVSLTWLISEDAENVEIDDKALELCIGLVEEAKKDSKVQLSAKQTARLSVYLYSQLKEGETLDVSKVNGIMQLYA